MFILRTTLHDADISGFPVPPVSFLRLGGIPPVVGQSQTQTNGETDTSKPVFADQEGKKKKYIYNRLP